MPADLPHLVLGAWPLNILVIALAILGLISLPLLVWMAVRLRRTPPAGRLAELDAVRISRRDPLTGLANRHGFGEVLAARLRSGSAFALILFDLDDFSLINSKHGTQCADELLASTAERLRSLVPDAGQIARLGADEFAILLDASMGIETIEAAALSIQRSWRTPLRAGTLALDCSVSLGIALCPRHAADADGLLRAAQAALGHAKAAGGASWRFFDPEHDNAQRLRAALKDELRGAIAGNQIVPFYQPIMDLRTNALTGLEVLARWQHPERGLLAPDIFIPLAEEMQLAGQITQSLMRRVIRDAREWPAWLYFAFNVSPGQLRELIGMVRNPPVWPEGELDPRRIEVEVTESALIEDIDVAREVIALLQARGTRVVLDDFGIGHSNFFHLRELPFDRIKIDKSFVLDIARDPRADACVRAMLALGGSLGIDMVAEGLEDAETEAYVAVLGCRFGQGYLYSPPIAANAVPALMRRLGRDAAIHRPRAAAQPVLTGVS
jgi:diguanylate cyclase (GGDEF)-like protein